MRLMLFSTAVCLAAAVAPAETVIAPYRFDDPEAGAISINYFQFGYTNDDDEFVPLTGNRIVESRLAVNFRPGMIDDGENPPTLFDVDHLEVSMVVPVLLDDPNGTELFEVRGSELIETAPGVFTFNLVTPAFNGEIRSGRFSLDIDAFDEKGEPVPLAGEFFGGSGFYYTVAVPEPATLALLPAAALLLRRRR